MRKIYFTILTLGVLLLAHVPLSALSITYTDNANSSSDLGSTISGLTLNSNGIYSLDMNLLPSGTITMSSVDSLTFDYFTGFLDSGDHLFLSSLGGISIGNFAVSGNGSLFISAVTSIELVNYGVTALNDTPGGTVSLTYAGPNQGTILELVAVQIGFLDPGQNSVPDNSSTVLLLSIACIGLLWIRPHLRFI